jgi:hypothetical protein
MEKRTYSLLLALVFCLVISASSLYAATFVVPPDRDMIRQATAIVIASALSSHTQLNDAGAIETVTVMSVEEVIKGNIPGDSVDIYEPGGAYGKRVTTIPGIPRFADGDRYVLFLMQYKNTWRVLNLILGKFNFATDVLGHEVLVRDEKEINGWDSDGKLHKVNDQNRAAEPFLNFIRGSVSGGPARQNYRIPSEPLLQVSVSALRTGLKPTPLCVFPCTPTSYTYDENAGHGPRWQTFPETLFSSVGANSAALTALGNAIAAWNNDAGSSVTLVNGGADDGTHTQGVNTFDGRSTVLFERDLTAKGALALTCGMSSYSGVLGVGAVTNSVGTHVGPNSETFDSAVEGDVEMNQGTSTCPFFLSTGDFNSGVAHEIGHTLGFRHSDQARNLFPGPASACSSDASLECSTTAIMKAFIMTGVNGALQTWDQHAAGKVYPNPTLTAPAGVSATVLTTSSIRVTWTTNGAATYRIYRIVNSVYTLAGTQATPPFDDTGRAADTAFLYVVRAFDGVSSESLDSNRDLASTTIFTALTPQVSVVAATDITRLRTLVNSVQSIAGIASTAYTDPTLNTTVTVKKAHIDELVSRLNTARTTVLLSGVSLSGGAITQFVTPIRASDVNDVRSALQ